MSRFFVGQRVRIVYTTQHHEFLGVETRIVGFGYWPANGKNRLIDATCRVDLPPFGKNKAVVVAECQLEPILPEGQQPTTWSECLWRPDGSHKKVAEEGRAIALRSIL